MSLIDNLLQNATGPYVFIGFMVISIIITVYLQIVMPETKGKTIAEVNALFNKRFVGFMFVTSLLLVYFHFFNNYKFN